MAVSSLLATLLIACQFAFSVSQSVGGPAQVLPLLPPAALIHLKTVLTSASPLPLELLGVYQQITTTEGTGRSII